MSRKFLRVDTAIHLRLGARRPKMQKWRRPRGKQNKIRLKRAGYMKMPRIGFKTARKDSGKIKGLVPKLVHNVQELQNITKDNIAIIARVGAKKKMEILKKAEELKIKILNAKAGGNKQ